MPADTGQYFDKKAGGGDIDIIGGDVIWPGQFAANGWIADLSDTAPVSLTSNSCRQFVTHLCNSKHERHLYRVWEAARRRFPKHALAPPDRVPILRVVRGLRPDLATAAAEPQSVPHSMNTQPVEL